MASNNTTPPYYIQNSTTIPQHPDLTYDLQIQPLQELQWHYQWPVFANSYPTPESISLHRQALSLSLCLLWDRMRESAIRTFRARLQCPRCQQLPLADESFLHLNHHLPRKALELWRTLRREMEGVDLVALRQEHLDDAVRGFFEIERMYWEGDVPGVGCGGVAWNGSRAEPPLDG